MQPDPNIKMKLLNHTTWKMMLKLKKRYPFPRKMRKLLTRRATSAELEKTRATDPGVKKLALIKSKMKSLISAAWKVMLKLKKRYPLPRKMWKLLTRRAASAELEKTGATDPKVKKPLSTKLIFQSAMKLMSPWIW